MAIKPTPANPGDQNVYRFIQYRNSNLYHITALAITLVVSSIAASDPAVIPVTASQGEKMPNNILDTFIKDVYVPSSV